MLKNFFEHKDYNRPVFESQSFVVIPSLGSLVEGWLLIVPKTFYLNFSCLTTEQFDELETVISHLNQNFLPLFNSNQFVVFEHGPQSTKSLAGCGVDYAHLHWIPTDLDLMNGIDRFLHLDYHWTALKKISDINKYIDADHDYLYLRDQQGRHFVTSQNHIPSQTFRKVIANYLDQPQNYDWKLNLGKEHIDAVYSKIKLQKV